MQQLETVTRQTLEDQDYAIDTALLSTQTHVVPRRDLESREEFAENLTDQIGDVTYGYTLYVDARPWPPPPTPEPSISCWSR